MFEFSHLIFHKHFLPTAPHTAHPEMATSNLAVAVFTPPVPVANPVSWEMGCTVCLCVLMCVCACLSYDLNLWVKVPQEGGDGAQVCEVLLTSCWGWRLCSEILFGERGGEEEVGKGGER